MTRPARRVAILGATRGMGRALARRMAGRGDRLFLLGRNPEELERSANDLTVRVGGDTAGGDIAGGDIAGGDIAGDAAAVPAVGFARCDLEEPATFAPALAAAEEALGGLDCVVVTAGLFAPQEELEADPELTRRLLAVDFGHSVLFCEEARRRLLAGGEASGERVGEAGGARRRTLCVFSSVAGERGRKPVILYGAAKAGLSRYLEGLDHKFRAAGLEVVCVKPGFVKTSMTAGLDPPPFAGEPDDVAERVLAAIDRGRPVVYAPAPWRWVMLVIRNLPRAVMRRVGF